MRTRTVQDTIIALTVLAVITGCSSNQTATGARGQMQRAVPVEVKQAAREEFARTFSLSGRVEASQQIDLTAKASGRIKEVYVQVGDQVKAGQPIASLDGEEIRIQAQRAEASLLSAQARVKDAREGTPAEGIAQTKNSIAELQQKYDAAKLDLERSEALFKEGAISSGDLEKARLQLVSASTSLENQKQKLKLDEKGPTQASVESAEAQLKQAEAELALAHLNVENLTLKAPIDGIIGTLAITQGEMVNTNTVVSTILNMKTMKVTTQASESQIGSFQNGQSVQVSIPSLRHAAQGKIISVSPIADSSKMFPVEIEIPNADLKVKAGMIASVTMSGDRRQAVVIPREAVISREQQQVVMIVVDEQAVEVPVQAGESDGERIEILSGLNGGESVIVKGQGTLASGASVVVIDPDKPEQERTDQGEQKKTDQPGAKPSRQQERKAPNSSGDAAPEQRQNREEQARPKG